MKWNHNDDMNFPMLTKCSDSHEHLFFQCEFTNKVWMFMKNNCNCESMSNKWDSIISEVSQIPNINNILKRIVINTIVYYFWNERNCRLFRDSKLEAEPVSKAICENVRLKLMNP
jgi:hypothetical protein